MSDLKISQLASGGSALPSDAIAIARAGVSYQLTLSELAIGLLAEETLAGDTATFDIANIPQTWTHLEIIAMLQSTESAVQSDVWVRFNGDSGTNYQCVYEYAVPGTQGRTPASDNVADTKMAVGLTSAANSGSADNFGLFKITIPFYTATGFRKALRAEAAFTREASNDPALTHGTGIWENTAAVTRITILPAAGNWKAGSKLMLYGRL